jgi:hypothetical protein
VLCSLCVGLGGMASSLVNSMKTYIVTVQLRAPAETLERKWTSAEDAADAIFLTLTHLSHAEGQRVERVLVQEKQQ